MYNASILNEVEPNHTGFKCDEYAGLALFSKKLTRLTQEWIAKAAIGDGISPSRSSTMARKWNVKLDLEYIPKN